MLTCIQPSEEGKSKEEILLDAVAKNMDGMAYAVEQELKYHERAQQKEKELEKIRIQVCFV